MQVGDLGDVPITIYNIFEAIKDIRKFISNVLKEDCTPLTMGGDHTITYPILQAVKVMIILILHYSDKVRNNEDRGEENLHVLTKFSK